MLADGSQDLHGEHLFVPGLRREFSAAEIAALAAPRLRLSLVGRDDPLATPAGVARIDRPLRAAYSGLGRPEAWRQQVFDAGHEETPAVRCMVLDTLARLGASD